jgi:CheY-like chemotaxis protein
MDKRVAAASVSGGVMSRHILLVEDNPDDELLIMRALKKNNIVNEVRVAHDGAEALDRLLGGSPGDEGLPGLILLDLKLPKLDGLEVLRRLRAEQRTQLVPVVVLTGSNQEDDIAASYRGGANAYVRKPVEFADFVDAIRTVGMFWLLLNQPPPGPG